ncbi:hypothetical protein ACHAQJ_003449 [Trichoderma viride]
MAPLKDIISLPVEKSINLQLLNSSADEFRKSQPSASGQPYDKIVVGAAILQHASDLASKTPQILLLKRASHEPYFPNVFELPSGKVDPDDPTLKHALFREINEETGLDVAEILAELKPMIYTTEKVVISATGEKDIISKNAIQLNYVVLTSPGDVRLNANEHSKSCWASEGELDMLDITDAMRVVIREAIQWALSQ